MKGINVNISAPNLVVICLDQINEIQQVGRIYHKYTKEPIRITTLGGILNTLESLFDRIGYPQSSMAARNFDNEKTLRKVREEEKQVSDAEKMLENKGELGTFVVHVQYRQHATWQGEVVWAEQNKKCRFRSALELLKLIDSALEEAPAAEEVPEQE